MLSTRTYLLDHPHAHKLSVATHTLPCRVLEDHRGDRVRRNRHVQRQGAIIGERPFTHDLATYGIIFSLYVTDSRIGMRVDHYLLEAMRRGVCFDPGHLA